MASSFLIRQRFAGYRCELYMAFYKLGYIEIKFKEVQISIMFKSRCRARDD